MSDEAPSTQVLYTCVQEQEVVIAEVRQVEDQHDRVHPERRRERYYPVFPFLRAVRAFLLIDEDHGDRQRSDDQRNKDRQKPVDLGSMVLSFEEGFSDPESAL